MSGPEQTSYKTPDGTEVELHPAGKDQLNIKPHVTISMTYARVYIEAKTTRQASVIYNALRKATYIDWFGTGED